MIDISKIQQGIALVQQGKYEEAEKLYSDLLKEFPNDAILLSAVGLFYVGIKNYDKALEFLSRAYQINKTVGTVSSLGVIEYRRKNYLKSAELMEEALLYGSNPDIYDILISSLFEIRKYKEAIEYADKMYELYPNNIKSITNRIKALTKSGNMREAEELCVETIKNHPENPMLWFQLGYLKELIYRDDKQAIECYKIAERYGAEEASYNIAVGLQKLGQKEEAEKYYQEMLKKFPDDKVTLTSFGMCRLSQKKFNEGYELFCKRDDSSVRRYCNRIWQKGDKLEDALTVVCEQGYGDHIQFIRYLPLIPVKKVFVAVPKELKNLFKINYPKFEFIDFEEVNPDIQAVRITDLAYLLGLDFEHIPYAEGYLDIDESLPLESEKLKIGLCWESGAAGIRTMINRTIHVKLFEPFFNLPNIQYYSFQYDDTFDGCTIFPQMVNLAKDFKDFTDTARAMKAMDAVITVDTSVAHLAGAMGVKTFLLLPYSSDWRWFDDKETTPWYNSVKIFKQTDPISWEKPFDDIMSELS